MKKEERVCVIGESERQTDSERERWSDGEMGRQTDLPKDRKYKDRLRYDGKILKILVIDRQTEELGANEEG